MTETDVGRRELEGFEDETMALLFSNGLPDPLPIVMHVEGLGEAFGCDIAPEVEPSGGHPAGSEAVLPAEFAAKCAHRDGALRGYVPYHWAKASSWFRKAIPRIVENGKAPRRAEVAGRESKDESGNEGENGIRKGEGRGGKAVDGDTLYMVVLQDPRSAIHEESQVSTAKLPHPLDARIYRDPILVALMSREPRDRSSTGCCGGDKGLRRSGEGDEEGRWRLAAPLYPETFRAIVKVWSSRSASRAYCLPRGVPGSPGSGVLTLPGAKDPRPIASNRNAERRRPAGGHSGAIGGKRVPLPFRARSDCPVVADVVAPVECAHPAIPDAEVSTYGGSLAVGDDIRRLKRRRFSAPAVFGGDDTGTAGKPSSGGGERGSAADRADGASFGAVESLSGCARGNRASSRVCGIPGDPGRRRHRRTSAPVHSSGRVGGDALNDVTGALDSATGHPVRTGSLRDIFRGAGAIKGTAPSRSELAPRPHCASVVASEECPAASEVGREEGGRTIGCPPSGIPARGCGRDAKGATVSGCGPHNRAGAALRGGANVGGRDDGVESTAAGGTAKVPRADPVYVREGVGGGNAPRGDGESEGEGEGEGGETGSERGEYGGTRADVQACDAGVRDGDEGERGRNHEHPGQGDAVAPSSGTATVRGGSILRTDGRGECDYGGGREAEVCGEDQDEGGAEEGEREVADNDDDDEEEEEEEDEDEEEEEEEEEVNEGEEEGDDRERGEGGDGEEVETGEALDAREESSAEDTDGYEGGDHEEDGEVDDEIYGEDADADMGAEVEGDCVEDEDDDDEADVVDEYEDDVDTSTCGGDDLAEEEEEEEEEVSDLDVDGLDEEDMGIDEEDEGDDDCSDFE